MVRITLNIKRQSQRCVCLCFRSQRFHMVPQHALQGASLRNGKKQIAEFRPFYFNMNAKHGLSINLSVFMPSQKSIHVLKLAWTETVEIWILKLSSFREQLSPWLQRKQHGQMLTGKTVSGNRHSSFPKILGFHCGHLGPREPKRLLWGHHSGLQCPQLYFWIRLELVSGMYIHHIPGPLDSIVGR